MAELRKLKDRAAELLNKGKPEKAAEVLREVLEADPKDTGSRQKLAELLRRAGQGAEAIANYRQVADRYARDGFLIKAIAVCKVILEIDPAHVETQTELAQLYARRNGPSAQAAPARDGSRLEAPPPRPERQAIELPPVTTEVPLELESLSGATVRDEGPAPAALEASSQPEGLAAAPIPPSVAVPTRPPVTDPFAGWQPRASAPAPTPTTAYEAILAAAAAAAAEDPGFPSFPGFPGFDDEVILEGEPIDAEPVEPDGFLDEPLPPSAQPGPTLHMPHIPLFSDLGPRPFVALAERSVLRQVKEGDAVLREGDRGTSFFVVATGRFRVEKRDAKGDKVVLAHLGEGAFFGEMALLSGAPRAAAVVAEVDCQILEITAALLQELCGQHPHVAQSLTRFYRQRLLANAMATSPVFGPFDKERRTELMERFLTHEVRAGEVVVREGVRSDGLYVVLSGELDVRKRKDAGEVLAGRLGACDVFGEVSCLRKGPASATVVANRSGTLLRLPRETFDEIVSAYPQVLELVSELSDERLQNLDAILSGRAEFTEDGLVLI
jgi:CRP-like cAMP-binding protein